MNMSQERTFKSTVTHIMTDDTGKVWFTADVSWENSSQAEAVAIQALLVKMLAQAVEMGFVVAGEEGEEVRELVRRVTEGGEK